MSKRKGITEIASNKRKIYKSPLERTRTGEPKKLARVGQGLS